MPDRIRLLVVDDHPVVRDGLVAMLGTQPDFEVAAEASNGTEAVEKAASYRPDVILLDLEMPGLDGVETLKRLRERNPDVRVIVFTAFDTDERILGAVRAGARGYLLKGSPRDELFQAIRVVHSGGSLLQPVVASRLIQQLSQPEAPEIRPPELTEREMEVLRLMAQGKANKEIAGALIVTERTVKFHVSSILAKLGASNRTEAVHRAAEHGLIQI